MGKIEGFPVQPEITRQRSLADVPVFVLPQAARQRFMAEDLFIHQLLVLELLSAGLSGDACCSYQLWECVVECCPDTNFLT